MNSLILIFMLMLDATDAFAFGPTAVARRRRTGPTTTRHDISGHRQSSSLVCLEASSSDNNSDGGTADGSMDEKARMAAVRSLQQSFYATSAEEPGPKLDTSTGIVTNLSLWRVGWVELPGRTNVLNVHEGQYTHMFEQILRRPQPWYFGHLFLDGGSKQLRNTPLVTHRETTPRSAQVGCLMQIRDYRRTQDGRLILFVQALERFVVDEVVQSLPYSVGHVQILPDIVKSADGSDDTDVVDENFAKIERVKRVKRAFQLHTYEFDDTKLPLPRSDYIESNAVFSGEELLRVLPFSFYSQDKSIMEDLARSNVEPSSNRDDSFGNETRSFLGGQPPLENQLLESGILKEPTVLTKTADQSETLIWLALEDYSRALGFVLQEQVLCLKPTNLDYLDMPDAEYPLSDLYPKERRQERLSYTAAGFLPRGLWQGLLEAGSTEARLEAILQRFQMIQDAMTGEFQ